MPGEKKEYQILVVEDNPGDFTLIEDFLFEHIEAPVIIQAKNFKEAKENLTKEHCRFDIILLDISLPDYNHEPLIKEIMDLCQDVPVIVLTGYADFTFGVRSLSLGISDYLLKDDLTSMSLYKSIIYSVERKKSIADLKESEKRYSDVFHFSPLPMWIVDLNTLRFLDVNQATTDHYGYTRKELLTMTMKDMRPAEDIPDLERRIAEDKLSPRPYIRRIVPHQKKNGEVINAEIQIAPFEYKGIKAHIVIANDITDRLNYLKAIEEQNEKFKEISWMQSHIVRAPLARIMGLIPLINTSDNEIEKQTMLNYITLSANELDDIIKNITDKTIMANYEITGQPNGSTNDKAPHGEG